MCIINVSCGKLLEADCVFKKFAISEKVVWYYEEDLVPLFSGVVSDAVSFLLTAEMLTELLIDHT